MKGRLLNGLVVVAVAAMVSLASASGSGSRALDTRPLTDELVTYRSLAGIGLGMTRKQVVQILGNCPGSTCYLDRQSSTKEAAECVAGASLGSEDITGSACFDSVLSYQPNGGSSQLQVMFLRERVVSIEASHWKLSFHGITLDGQIRALIGRVRKVLPRKTVRCLVNHRFGYMASCWAQRLGPGSTSYKVCLDRPGHPCSRRPVPKVFLIVFEQGSWHEVSRSLSSIRVTQCDPRPPWGHPPANPGGLWEPCAPDFLTYQRKWPPTRWSFDPASEW